MQRPYRHDKARAICLNMTIREEIQRLEELIRFIEVDLPRYAERVGAIDLAALVADRVINKGEDFRGRAFTPYSTNTVAAWRFWGKSRNQSAEKKVRDLARKKGVLAYDEFRKLNKLNTDKKNFEFTGEMWKKFGVLRADVNSAGFKVIIGGQTKASQDKIDANSQREGVSIIEASESEIATVGRTSLEWLEEQAERILNG